MHESQLAAPSQHSAGHILEICLMKFFRVSLCLALLMAGVACNTAPQAITAPSASVGGSTAATNPDGSSTLKVSAPAQISPVDGARAEDRRPALILLYSVVKYTGGYIDAYDIELSTPVAVVYSRTVGISPEYGAHLIDLELDYDTVYLWRVRAHGGNPDSVGPWSPWTSSLSPTRPAAVAPPPGAAVTGGCAAPISPLGPGETRKPRPNDSAIVRSIAAHFPGSLARSCQPEGGSWEFSDRSVGAVRAEAGRYGYHCKQIGR